jgi:hypothetical protein
MHQPCHPGTLHPSSDSLQGRNPAMTSLIVSLPRGQCRRFSGVVSWPPDRILTATSSLMSWLSLSVPPQGSSGHRPVRLGWLKGLTSCQGTGTTFAPRCGSWAAARSGWGLGWLAFPGKKCEASSAPGRTRVEGHAAVSGPGLNRSVQHLASCWCRAEEGPPRVSAGPMPPERNCRPDPSARRPPSPPAVGS